MKLITRQDEQGLPKESLDAFSFHFIHKFLSHILTDIWGVGVFFGWLFKPSWNTFWKAIYEKVIIEKILLSESPSSHIYGPMWNFKYGAVTSKSRGWLGLRVPSVSACWLKQRSETEKQKKFHWLNCKKSDIIKRAYPKPLVNIVNF